MAKKNKVRYKAKELTHVLITLTGKCFLMYRDDADALAAQKGDVLIYPCNDALNTIRQGEYESTGFAGYFKVDVSDGKAWQPVLLQEIFPGKENHFAKRECPIDTYVLCEDMLRQMQGKQLRRTYREHYELFEEEAEEATS